MALPGNPRGGTSRCTSPRHEGGRRRAGSVVSDLPVTSAQPRCSCVAGTPGATRRPRRPELKEDTGAVSISEPAPPTISRMRVSNRCESEGGASPTLRRRRRTRRPEVRETPRHTDLPPNRSAPPSLGHAIQTAARLMGGRGARPHNTAQKAGGGPEG